MTTLPGVLRTVSHHPTKTRYEVLGYEVLVGHRCHGPLKFGCAPEISDSSPPYTAIPIHMARRLAELWATPGWAGAPKLVKHALVLCHDLRVLLGQRQEMHMGDALRCVCHPP